MNKNLNSYYFLFFLTIFLIVLILIANYKTYQNENIDIQLIKSYPWEEERSSYIKQFELYSKLSNKPYLDDNDLPLLDELISISEKIKDFRTLRFSLNLKYRFLIDQLILLSDSKYINIILKSLDFKSKVGLFFLTENQKIIETFTPEELEKFNHILELINQDENR